jgi:phosphoribosylamine--glycine ligase
MKILIVGAGGREHALVWKIAQSPLADQIYCAPGNAGIEGLAARVEIDAEDIDALTAFATQKEIDLTIVGPEGPLSMGIVDRFEAAGLRIFGANRRAAEIESSKSFTKRLLMKYGIPTAAGRIFTDFAAAKSYILETGPPIVVKADGLAAGKGVFVCDTEDEAVSALETIMRDKVFGEAGDTVIVEERLTGEEASFLAFTDGKTVLPLPSSQDHKPVYDNDKGPNTGGMGAYSPAPVVDGYMHRKIMQTVMLPTVQAMAGEGRPYKGVLYAGLMIDGDKVKVLEFNARFGDPEAQPLLMRLKSDLVPVMMSVVSGTLDEQELAADPRAAVCVVMASGGYPGAYKKGIPISGLDAVANMTDVVVFHAGTAYKEDAVVTAGGRVLGVTALGETVQQAVDRAYRAVDEIKWENVHYRTDIGGKALKRRGIQPRVGIVMGSDSDLPIMDETVSALKTFHIPYEMTVASAHRTPDRAARYAAEAMDRGIQVIIAGAGHAAHLAGILAAHTPLPVIGVPIDSSALRGYDALLSTVQMPPGVPVATMAVGKPGARNAGIFAAQILAAGDDQLAGRLAAFKQNLATQVEKKAKRLEAPE